MDVMKKLDKDFNELVGKRIREYRIKNDVSQEELGKYLKLPKQTISTIEKGKRRVTGQELVLISAFFDEPTTAFTQEAHKYVYIVDTNYGALPVFIADFLKELVHYANKIDTFKIDGKRFFNRLIDAIKIILREAKNK